MAIWNQPTHHLFFTLTLFSFLHSFFPTGKARWRSGLYFSSSCDKHDARSWCGIKREHPFSIILITLFFPLTNGFSTDEPAVSIDLSTAWRTEQCQGTTERGVSFPGTVASDLYLWETWIPLLFLERYHSFLQCLCEVVQESCMRHALKSLPQIPVLVP